MFGKHSKALVFSSILKTIIVNVSKRLKFLVAYVIISVTFKVNKYQIAINPLRKTVCGVKKEKNDEKPKIFYFYSSHCNLSYACGSFRMQRLR